MIGVPSCFSCSFAKQTKKQKKNGGGLGTRLITMHMLLYHLHVHVCTFTPPPHSHPLHITPPPHSHHLHIHTPSTSHPLHIHTTSTFTPPPHSYHLHIHTPSIFTPPPHSYHLHTALVKEDTQSLRETTAEEEAAETVDKNRARSLDQCRG